MVANSYIITGPTASGKSGFAHLVAKKIGGVIINCDSVQMYRGIENISASPFAGRDLTEDIDGVPYRLFSILPLSQQISVSDYIDKARYEYNRALRLGLVPVFVGGTGYYINAIINGISPMPDISPENRMRAREMVAADIDAVREMLGNDVVVTDPQRVARALEVFLETGRHLIEFQSAPRVGAIVDKPKKILINPSVEVLRERIVARISDMLSGGALDEAQYIIDNGLDAARAIGAYQLVAFLRGDFDKQDCIKNWIVKTNQYAKRQRTWFRTQFDADIEINYVPTESDVELVI